MHQSCRYLSLLSSPCMKRLGGGFAGSGPLLRDSDVQAVLGSNVLPVFRLLHAEVAAAAAVLARNIRLATGHIPVSLYCTALHVAESCMAFWGLDAHQPARNVVACTVCCAGGHAAVFVGYACNLRQRLQPRCLSQPMSTAASAPACTAVHATIISVAGCQASACVCFARR